MKGMSIGQRLEEIASLSSLFTSTATQHYQGHFSFFATKSMGPLGPCAYNAVQSYYRCAKTVAN